MHVVPTMALVVWYHDTSVRCRGLFFFPQVVRSGVDPQFGLFESTSEGLLYSRPAAVKLEQGVHNIHPQQAL